MHNAYYYYYYYFCLGEYVFTLVGFSLGWFCLFFSTIFWIDLGIVWMPMQDLFFHFVLLYCTGRVVGHYE